MDIPPGCEIEWSAFVHCPMDFIGDFVVPEGITVIGDQAFSGCSSLTHIHIPKSVTSIGDLAFEECTNLVSAIVPKTCSVDSTAFPPSCKIFNSTAEYRAHLAKTLAAEHSRDGVEIVGMHAPAIEPENGRSGRAGAGRIFVSARDRPRLY